LAARKKGQVAIPDCDSPAEDPNRKKRKKKRSFLPSRGKKKRLNVAARRDPRSYSLEVKKGKGESNIFNNKKENRPFSDDRAPGESRRLSTRQGGNGKGEEGGKAQISILIEKS